MSFARPLILAAALVGAPAVLAQSYPGQQVQTVPRPTPDADALADAMRRLGANPRDLSSLLAAGELSLRLGDVNAAASLFKRAENVDPMNGRVKAGMARILVTQERPGEALRFFDQAVGYGLDARSFAGDRGLAYDLIGEQERAQRDYRTALQGGPNEEVRRRYALSLGISGKRKEALAEIDDQLRGNDRSAWRVRAFVLAMTGDVPGAEKIASTMMPPGMGTALAPFFARLAALSPTDRAFAVHFGELRPTPQRLADARMVPALPALLPEARASVQVAAAPPNAAPDSRNDRRRAREDARRQRDIARAEQRARRSGRPAKPPVAVASASPTRPQASETDGFQPPRYAGVAFAPPKAVVQAVPVQPIVTAPPPVTAGPAVTPTPSSLSTSAPLSTPPAQLAAATPRPLPTPPVQAAASTPRLLPTPLAAATSGSLPGPLAGAAPRPSLGPPAATSSRPLPASPSAGVRPGFSSGAPTAATAVTSVTAAPAPRPDSAPAPATSSLVQAAPPINSAISEDTILARIMAGISIPGEELGIAPVRPPGPAPAPQPVAAAPGTSVATPASIAANETARRAAETAREPQRPVATATVRQPSPKKPEPAAKIAEKPPVDLKKVALDRKAAAAKKLADAKKAAEAKKVAEEAKAAKADPARIWVQVAGGANKGDLSRAWATAQGKAPALKGKSAYTTPLRFTNRVVTGPFKTDAEAREFVNTLAKQGISAFTFVSEKGQKLERLPAK